MELLFYSFFLNLRKSAPSADKKMLSADGTGYSLTEPHQSDATTRAKTTGSLCHEITCRMRPALSVSDDRRAGG
jgi:hypothetical protein